MDNIPPLRISQAVFGNIDSFAVKNGHADLQAWIAHPTETLTHASVYINGSLWQRALALRSRPDVRAAFPRRPQVIQSGISITAPIDDSVGDPYEAIVKIVPSHNGKEFDYYETRFLNPEYEKRRYRLPPIKMQDNVGGASEFLAVSFESTRLLKTYVERYFSFKAKRILDWGCGCGRTARTLLYYVKPSDLFGCDIDWPAIEWVSSVIKEASFININPYPPTPYPDNYFDIVYGFSVMTHLSESVQQQWLTELRRISAPGAIVVLSVLNESLRHHLLRPEIAEDFAIRGEASFHSRDAYFDRITPKEYYRTTFHSIEYIRATWSKYFDLLEYVTAETHQDLVIMRRN
ncbi:MAG: class I SAM-dependent methyltransferase [Candidatus Binataceae bacterium]